MASLNWSGIYKLESSENFEEYLRARGASSDVQIQEIMQVFPTVEIIQNGDDFYMKTIVGDKPVQELKFKLGRQWFTQGPDGKRISNVFYMDENKLVQKQTDELGRFVEYIRELEENYLILIMTHGDIVTRRKFRKQ